MPMSFVVAAEDRKPLDAVVDRAEGLALLNGRRRFDLWMDLAVVNANGCPLDFERLAEFPDFDFAHDVVGIQMHLDRTTGQLGRCFVPRCAKPEREAQDE